MDLDLDRTVSPTLTPKWYMPGRGLRVPVSSRGQLRGARGHSGCSRLGPRRRGTAWRDDVRPPRMSRLTQPIGPGWRRGAHQVPEFADPASGICRGICLVQFGELAHGMLSLGTAGAPGPFPAYGAVRRPEGRARASVVDLDDDLAVGFACRDAGQPVGGVVERQGAGYDISVRDGSARRSGQLGGCF